jgi:hypothetical protein
MKVKRLHVYLTIVSLCAGFLLSYSYQFTQKQEHKTVVDPGQWYKEDQLRETLMEAQKENKSLEKHLR